MKIIGKNEQELIWLDETNKENQLLKYCNNGKKINGMWWGR